MGRAVRNALAERDDRMTEIAATRSCYHCRLMAGQLSASHQQPEPSPTRTRPRRDLTTKASKICMCTLSDLQCSQRRWNSQVKSDVDTKSHKSMCKILRFGADHFCDYQSFRNDKTFNLTRRNVQSPEMRIDADCSFVFAVINVKNLLV